MRLVIFQKEAPVKQDNKWGVINKEKKGVITFKYDEVHLIFQWSCTEFAINGKQGFY